MTYKIFKFNIYDILKEYQGQSPSSIKDKLVMISENTSFEYLSTLILNASLISNIPAQSLKMIPQIMLLLFQHCH